MRCINLFFVVAMGLSLALEASAFQGPLDQPALSSNLAVRSPMLAVTNAGARLVAVGQRGHIIFSDNGGDSWKQAEVPVSTDLVSVSFPTEKQGWAVGHGGVVIHTTDGGETWFKQLDGRKSAEIAIRYLESKKPADPATENLIVREKRLLNDSGTQPLMGVYFQNESTGFVVGTFNRIFRTQDGGKTWVPWIDRIDNPNDLHFYSVLGDAKGIYVAGEQGMVWRMDGDKQHFVAQPLPYQGSVFGLLTNGSDTLFAFGLRGSLYRSLDQGKSWENLSIGSSAGITAGMVQTDGSILLVTQSGGIMRSTDNGRTYNSVNAERPMAYYGISSSPKGGIVLVGSEGVRIELTSSQPKKALSQ